MPTPRRTGSSSQSARDRLAQARDRQSRFSSSSSATESSQSRQSTRANSSRGTTVSKGQTLLYNSALEAETVDIETLAQARDKRDPSPKTNPDALNDALYFLVMSFIKRPARSAYHALKWACIFVFAGGVFGTVVLRTAGVQTNTQVSATNPASWGAKATEGALNVVTPVVQQTHGQLVNHYSRQAGIAPQNAVRQTPTPSTGAPVQPAPVTNLDLDVVEVRWDGQPVE